jgi:hypothetical protein
MQRGLRSATPSRPAKPRHRPGSAAPARHRRRPTIGTIWPATGARERSRPSSPASRCRRDSRPLAPRQREDGRVKLQGPLRAADLPQTCARATCWAHVGEVTARCRLGAGTRTWPGQGSCEVRSRVACTRSGDRAPRREAHAARQAPWLRRVRPSGRRARACHASCAVGGAKPGHGLSEYAVVAIGLPSSPVKTQEPHERRHPTTAPPTTQLKYVPWKTGPKNRD